MKRLLLVLWLTGLCLAQQPLFIPVWMQNSDPLTDQTLNQVVGEVARVNPNPAQDSPTHALATGPMDFFTRRIVNSAFCQIQAMWEGTVLAKAGRLAPSQLQQTLFAEQGGIVRNFADTTLGYFLNHTINGYEPETVVNQSLPFTPDFLSFLNAGTSGYKPVRNELHPTMKPVELVERAINNSSKTRDIVLDCFGGSGTTLIACEKLNRQCRMIELDPKYADVIVRRWEEFTGKKAELVAP